MNLKSYLESTSISLKQFSEQIKYSEPYLKQIMERKMFAGKKLAGIIENATYGQVKKHEVMRPICEKTLNSKSLTLKGYLKATNTTVFQFAKSINYNSTYISTIMNAGKIPSKELVLAIKHATSGKVNFDKIDYQF